MSRLPSDFGKTWHTAHASCPNCGKLCDAATKMLGVAGAGPAPGNFSLCWNCAAVNEFVEKEEGVLTLAPADLSRLTSEELKQLKHLQHRVAARKN